MNLELPKKYNDLPDTPEDVCACLLAQILNATSFSKQKQEAMYDKIMSHLDDEAKTMTAVQHLQHVTDALSERARMREARNN